MVGFWKGAMYLVWKGRETEGRREGAAKEQLASMDGRTKYDIGNVVHLDLATILLMSATAGLEGRCVHEGGPFAENGVLAESQMRSRSS